MSTNTTWAALTNVGTDRAIRNMWDAALAADDEDEIDFHVLADQWWGVSARCNHGKWRAGSNGAFDLSRAFERLMAQFVEAHEGLGA